MLKSTQLQKALVIDQQDDSCVFKNCVGSPHEHNYLFYKCIKKILNIAFFNSQKNKQLISKVKKEVGVQIK